MRRVALAFAVLSIPSAAWAGAWTLPEGTGQWLAGFTATTSTMYFTGAGLAPTPRYTKEEAQALIEYGLTDRLTAIIIPGLQNIDIAAPTSAERAGLNYTEFGARYGFYKVRTGSYPARGRCVCPAPPTPRTRPRSATPIFKPMYVFWWATTSRSTTCRAFSTSRRPSARAPKAIRANFTSMPPWASAYCRNGCCWRRASTSCPRAPGLSYFGGSYEYYKVELSALYTVMPTWQVQFGGVSTYAGRNALQENGFIVGLWHQF